MVTALLAMAGLGEIAERIRTADGLPAFAVASVRGDRIEEAIVGVRRSDREGKVGKDDRWPVGSITKSMTATMVARLVDRKLLRWDTTLAEALPGVEMRDEYRSVTLLQLLRHRGGVAALATMTGDEFEKIEGDAKEPFALRDRLVRNVLQREPVKGFVYSNAGYAMAGHIAEIAAKKPFERLMRDELFRPLGMKTAQVGPLDLERDVVGHVEQEAKALPYAPYDDRFCAAFAPAGIGVAMSIGDLARFARFHLKGLRGEVSLMGEPTFRRLHKTPTDGDYACGWVAFPSGRYPEPLHWHNGSDGTALAEVALFPKKGLAVVAVANLVKPGETSAAKAIRAVYGP